MTSPLKNDGRTIVKSPPIMSVDQLVVAVKAGDATTIAAVDGTMPPGCWEWPGATRGGGYGATRVGQTIQYVHRLVLSYIGEHHEEVA